MTYIRVQVTVTVTDKINCKRNCNGHAALYPKEGNGHAALYPKEGNGHAALYPKEGNGHAALYPKEVRDVLNTPAAFVHLQ
jgi:hypothetical protein